ncbi:MAG: hypothetical protein MZV70_43515 [Desulfobacterales bacterium]|nr:hypothetical protein [Desulfobacterales bacterium]
MMMGNEVFFVLKGEQEISSIQVAVFDPEKGNSRGETMWAASHDLATKVEERKYPSLQRIKYGQALNQFPQVSGPAPLKRDVEYLVAITMGDKFAREVFILTEDKQSHNAPSKC